jgi:membrane-associated phospholipid phosphatase
MAACGLVPAERAEADAWNRLADAGRGLLVGSGILGPLLRRDTRTSFDVLTAALAASAASKALKAFWHEPRPNGEDDNSFPSQHAGDCFAAAAVLHRRWGDPLGAIAVGVATAVSMARVFSGKHHVIDVITGAALGVCAAELAFSLPD